MEYDGVITWLAAGAGLAALVRGAGAYREFRVRRALAAFAAGQGMRFEPRFRAAPDWQSIDLLMLRRGHHRRIGLLLRAAGDSPILFACHYEVGRGWRRRDCLLSVGMARTTYRGPGLLAGPLAECRAAEATLGFCVVADVAGSATSAAIAAQTPELAEGLAGAEFPDRVPDQRVECREGRIAVAMPGPLTPERAAILLRSLDVWMAWAAAVHSAAKAGPIGNNRGTEHQPIC